MPDINFPSSDHAELADVVADTARRLAEVDTVLIVNSVARGTAVAESDLDMAVLVVGELDDAEALEAELRARLTGNPVAEAFRRRGPFSHIHADFFDGNFTHHVWDEGGGPDEFEIEIGNRVAFAVPLDSSGAGFDALRSRWLPYYDEDLRRDRLAMARDACRYDMDHVPFYQNRDLHLQAFDRLYKGFREYLQALFIAHRTYPLAYNKWLHEQLSGIGCADLFNDLLSLIAVADLRGPELGDRARRLVRLADELPD